MDRCVLDIFKYYLLEYPSKTQELLKYMSIIREAATRYPRFQCRLYDEQFRLRQALGVQSWEEINSDLWLRCFSSRSPFTVQSSSPQSTVSQRTPTCLDFNKGSCKWSVCRYLHVCAICSSSAHGKWECPNNTLARLEFWGTNQCLKTGETLICCGRKFYVADGWRFRL